MRFVSDIAVGLACLSAAFAILFYLTRRRAAPGLSRKACRVAMIGLLAFGVSRVASLAAMFWPGAPGLDLAQTVALGVALVAAMAIWGFLPGLLAEPSSGALLEANRALSGAAAQSAEELSRLAASNSELERAVAERARALDEANHRFEMALRNTGVSMAQQDCELRYVWVHNSPKGLSAEQLLGRLQQDALPPETHVILAAAKRDVMSRGAPGSIDVRMSIGGADRFFNENMEPMWRNGEVVGVLTTSIETTNFRRQQEELRGLLRELTHRTKNLLAVIMGIARQSGRSATDVDSFVARFNGRLRAIAATHELLVESEWRGVGLRSLIGGVWRAVSPETRGLLSLEGEERLLLPESAQNLALAIYEMQSNAMAHGGLLEPGGGVSIVWRDMPQEAPDEAAREGGEASGGVELVWRENGRRAPPAPELVDGFGRTFVHVLLPRATKGRSVTSWEEEGLVWRLTLPALNFVAEPARA